MSTTPLNEMVSKALVLEIIDAEINKTVATDSERLVLEQLRDKIKEL